MSEEEKIPQDSSSNSKNEELKDERCVVRQQNLSSQGPPSTISPGKVRT